MNNRILLILLLMTGFALNVQAQVQANKQLQMTGSSQNDRRITGIGNAADSADAVNAVSIQQNRLTYATGNFNANNYSVTLSVAPEAYAPGMIVSFKAAAANTGSITLNINGLGAKPVFKNVEEALEPADIASNQIVTVMYDGSAFQVISQLKRPAGFTGALAGEVTGTQQATLIANGAVVTNRIADGAVTDNKIANGISYSKLSGAPTSLPPSGTASGDLTGNYPNPVVADAAISAGKLADGAVTSLKLQDGAVISLKLADGSVLTAKIADAAITTAKIQDDAVTSAKIADDAVTSNKIQTGAINDGHLQDGSVIDSKIQSVSYSKVTGAPTALPPNGTAGGDLTGNYPNPTVATGSISEIKLTDNAVATAKIQDGAVTSAKLAPGVIPTALPPNGTAAGDLTGNYPAPTIASGAVTEAKMADASVSTAKVQDASITAEKLAPGVIPSALPPTGAAGGALMGTYPNPGIADDAITINKIADGSISTLKLIDASVITSKIEDGSVTAAKLAPGVLPTSLPPSGAAGGDLTGNYPNPVIADNSVTNTKIGTGAVSVDKIDGSVALPGQVISWDGSTVIWSTPSSMGAAGGDLTGMYPNPSIAGGAVTDSKIAPGAISDVHVNAAAAIAYSKLNLNNSVLGSDLVNNAVTTTKMANGAVTPLKINTSGALNGQVLTYNGTSVIWGSVSAVPSGAAGGDLTGNYPNPTVATGTISSAKIADGSITNVDVNAAAAIAYSKLNLSNSILNTDITNSAITTGKISDNAVTTGKIADDAITDAKVAVGISFSKLIGVPTFMLPGDAAGGDLSGSYPNPVIATDAITTVKISDNAITTNKIADASVTAAKINAGTATGGQVLTYDGTTVKWADAAGAGPSLQFHGTVTTAATYNSGNTVIYDNATSNSGSQMDMSSGIFTAASNGLYQVNASFPSSAGADRFLALRVNGTDVFTSSTATSFLVGSPYNATISALSLSVAYPLNANDTVEIIVYNSAGTASPMTNGTARLLITKLN